MQASLKEVTVRGNPQRGKHVWRRHRSPRGDADGTKNNDKKTSKVK